MSAPGTALVQAWDLADDDEETIEDPQTYADELVAIMTEILDQNHPLPTKINNTTYTENLTTSSCLPPSTWPRPRPRPWCCSGRPGATRPLNLSDSSATSAGALVPSWSRNPKIGSRMINARAETLAEKPVFRSAYRSRRCLIGMSGFFEWLPTEQLGRSGKPLKQPFYLHPRDDSILPAAGLYEFWRNPDAADDADDAWLTTSPSSPPPRPTTSATSTTGCR